MSDLFAKKNSDFFLQAWITRVACSIAFLPIYLSSIVLSTLGVAIKCATSFSSQEKIYKLKQICQIHKFYPSFSYSHKILHFFDSNTILTSLMTSGIVGVIIFLYLCLIFMSDSFMHGASVIGHGIMAGKLAH